MSTHKHRNPLHGSHPTRSERRNRHPPGDAADASARGRAGAGRAARARLGDAARLGDSRSVLRPPVSSLRAPRRRWPGWSVRPSCATAVSTTARSPSDSSAMPRPPRSSRRSSSPPLPSWTRAPSLSGSSPPPCSASSRSPAGTCVSIARGRRERPLRVLGLGAGEEAARLARAFDEREAHGVELVGFVGNHSHAVVPVLGRARASCPRSSAAHDIDAIVLTANRHRLPLLEHLLGVGDRTPAVLELSDLYERAFGCVPVEEINAAWFIEALTLHRRLQDSVARRSVDVVVSALAAVAAAAAHAARRARRSSSTRPARCSTARCAWARAAAASRSSSSARCAPMPRPPAPRSGPPSATRASRASAPSSAASASTSCPSCGTSCAARWRSSGPARSVPSSSPRSHASCPSTSRATSCAPASPGGRRCTRPTQRRSRRRSRNCPTTSTTSSTSRSPQTPESCSARLGVMAGGRGAR